jgi:methyl-accepting chemotaxis protein
MTMRLRTKLMLAPALSGAILSVTIGSSLWVLSDFKSRSTATHAAVLSGYSRVADERARLGELHARLYRTITIIGSMDDAAVRKMRQEQARVVEDILAGIPAQPSGAGSDVLERYAAQLRKYRKAADDAIDLSTVDPNTGVAALQTADAAYKATSQTLADVIAGAQARAAVEEATLESSARRAAMATSVLGALAVALSLGIAWITQRRIATEVAAAAQAAAHVAAGRLDVDLKSDASDEMGDLVRALGAMVTQLRQSILSVRQAAHSIGTASTEIAQGNSDLSTRTEEAASSLQQTAASMEQLTGTVRQSAESATTAQQLADSATRVAQRGGTVVDQVVATMEEIDASSRRIADIIAVIDGIAFQTNILALNAAVEAARAGDQGRGFAVVAGEVRNLAQRSAQAAREIKALIGTSVEKVDTGSRLVADAGRTMREIVASVQRVTDMIGAVTAAAAEQSTGIEQISGAVSQLDRMTQQNASLVEESAAAALSLRNQALTLTDAVAAFRLHGEAA